MNAEPTPTEWAHYAKLSGWLILKTRWEEFEGRPLPILVLGQKGRTVEAAVLCDPEGNGPGYLDHPL